MPLDHPTDDVRCEPVDVGPRIRAPDEPDEPREVRLAQQARVPAEQGDGGRSKLVPAGTVELVDHRPDLCASEVWMRASEVSARAADLGHGRSVEPQIAL